MELVNSSCIKDDTFGPFVDASCRGGYDFTILFEEAVFCLVPVLILLLALPLRLKSLFSRPRRVRVTKFHYAKLVCSPIKRFRSTLTHVECYWGIGDSQILHILGMGIWYFAVQNPSYRYYCSVVILRSCYSCVAVLR